MRSGRSGNRAAVLPPWPGAVTYRMEVDRASDRYTLGATPNFALNWREKWLASENPHRHAMEVIESVAPRKSSLDRANLFALSAPENVSPNMPKVRWTVRTDTECASAAVLIERPGSRRWSSTQLSISDRSVSDPQVWPPA